MGCSASPRLAGTSTTAAWARHLDQSIVWYEIPLQEVFVSLRQPLIYRYLLGLGAAVLVTVGSAPSATASGGSSAPHAPVTVTGFDAPESVVHDRLTDTYLVSNIGGALPQSAVAEDGNGFISKVAPDGTVLDRAWIGLGEDDTLNAPKGLAFSRGSLYVADINVVHQFDRRNGSLIRTMEIPGAVFLNDVARAPEGGVFVSDSALVVNADGTGLEPADGDAIYRVGRGGALSTVAKGPDLDSPNGLTVDRRGRLLGVSIDTSNEVYTINEAGARETVRATPVGQLDGLEVLRDGSYVVSSFGEAAVVRVPRNGEAETLFSGRTAADIGIDRCRGLLLMPLLLENELVIQPL
jgi:hypothetical protein